MCADLPTTTVMVHQSTMHLAMVQIESQCTRPCNSLSEIYSFQLHEKKLLSHRLQHSQSVHLQLASTSIPIQHGSIPISSRQLSTRTHLFAGTEHRVHRSSEIQSGPCRTAPHRRSRRNLPSVFISQITDVEVKVTEKYPTISTIRGIN
jgi:hypothetical protein